MTVNRELKGIIYGKYDNQSALASKLGWPRQRLNKIVTGQKMRNVEELNSLAVALNVPVDRMIHIFYSRSHQMGNLCNENATNRVVSGRTHVHISLDSTIRKMLRVPDTNVTTTTNGKDEST